MMTLSKEEAERVTRRFPTRVIVVMHPQGNNTPRLDRYKYVVHSHWTMGHFVGLLRERLKLSPHEALFCFCNNALIPMSNTLGQVKQKHQATGGVVYISYANENTFG